MKFKASSSSSSTNGIWHMGYASEAAHGQQEERSPIRDEELMEKFVEYTRKELKHLDYLCRWRS